MRKASLLLPAGVLPEPGFTRSMAGMYPYQLRVSYASTPLINGVDTEFIRRLYGVDAQLHKGWYERYTGIAWRGYQESLVLSYILYWKLSYLGVLTFSLSMWMCGRVIRRAHGAKGIASPGFAAEFFY